MTLKSKIDANRRFIDDVLKRIQDQNHPYFLEKLRSEPAAGRDRAKGRKPAWCDAPQGYGLHIQVDTGKVLLLAGYSIE